MACCGISRNATGPGWVTADIEESTLVKLAEALEHEVRDEWTLSAVDWKTFVEADLHKGGKCLHSITKLCEVPRSEKS